MKKKRLVKSILSVMLTMAMIFGTVQLPFAPESVVVHAETVASGACGDNLTWTLDDTGKLTISGSGAMAMNFVGSSEVPWYGYDSDITSVEIEEGVTSIGNSAFSYCSGLTTVTIPDSVTSIGIYAFYNCNQLTSITIPYSVTSIGDCAFEDCSALQTVYAPVGLNLSDCEIRQGATITEYYAAKLAPTEHGTVTVSGGTSVPNCGAYFTNGGTATLTVTPDAGYVIGNVKYNDGDDHILEKANDGTYSFTMPTDMHVTVTAEFVEIIKYIDENGVERECSSYTVLEGGGATTLEGGWYVVKDTNPNDVDAAYKGTVTINGAANIILCNGAEMSVDVSAGNAIMGTSALAIFGQNGQSGKLTVSNKVSNYSPIFMDKAPITINGGDIVIDGKVNKQAIYINHDSSYSNVLTVNDGHISTTEEIYSHMGLNINGGQVEAGKINDTGGSVTLGYRKATDYIKADLYCSYTDVADGKAFLTDDNPKVLIKGTVSNGGDPISINGKKLVPALTLTIADNIEHGSVGVSNGIVDSGVYYVAVGDAVDLIISADGGYTLDTLTVKDASDNPITVTNSSFTMPAENVTVSATFVPGGYCGASTNVGGESSVTWSLDDEGKLTISGTGDMADFDSGVPWNDSIDSITNVVIEEGVTSIGKIAFSNHSNLESVTIADSVTSIGKQAFFQCEMLTGINIPKNVSSIGTDAFGYCTSLPAINVDGNNSTYASDDGVLFNKDKTMLICYPNGKSGNSYIIPDTVTSIGDDAFNMCKGLSSITIPDSVTSIGEAAFGYCNQLTTITIPDGVTSIGERAFSDCTGLTSITIPDSVTSIGERAFEDCYSLTTITIPDSVTSIGEYAFYDCTILTTITIPDSVTSIGECAFKGCMDLTTITIPDSVTSIGVDAFKTCDDLQTVYAPVGLTIPVGGIGINDSKIKKYYAVKLAPTEHGTVTVSGGDVPNWGAYFTDESDNRTATLNITPDDGYKLDSLTVKDASDNPITVTNSSFTMPADKHVTVTAEFIPDILSMSGEANYKAYDGHTLTGSTTGTVTIADKATVTLSNATISGGITCEGDATIILAGENTVTAPPAGLNVPNHAGIYVPQSKTLTINGDGKLNATGGYDGAGIGGEYGKACGSITINNGVVFATGGYKSAGIGGAYGASFDNIEINGGIVTAQGGTYAAGIGGSGYTGGTGGNIAITGGKVNATGGEYAAGIGCGCDGSCKDILIEGGDITATGGEGAAGIGGAFADGNSTKCLKITITSGIKNLEATPGPKWEIAIGKGEKSSCGTVTIGDIEFQNNEIKGNPFTTKPFSISFEAGDGTGSMDSEKVMENVSDEYVLPDCSFTAPEGKAFKEWSVNIGDAGAVTKAAGESVKITGDTTVTATYVTIVETPVAVADLIYDGTEKTGVVSGDGYTVTGNTATNAGTYKATATLNDGYIWSDRTTEDKVIEWSIAKATPVAPTELKATTGQTLANVTLPDGWTWADKTLSVGNAGTNVFKATYTPADTTNYNAVENVELSVVVSKATSNTNGGSTSSGGGSTSGGGNTSGGGGSSSGNTDNKDTTEKTTTPVTEKTTNADGSVTEKTTTTNTDGSKTETSKTTAKDGTITEAEKTTAKDGTVKETEKTTATDGTVTETQKTTSTDGTVTESEKTTSTDGSVKEVEKTTSTDGTIVEKTSETDEDGSSVVSEKVTEKDGSSSETTVTVDSNGKAKSIVATDSDGKKDSQTVAFEVKGNKATVSSIDTSTGKVTIPETIDAPDGKTYTVTKLDKDAFDGQKLKELSLPDTIKVINPKALENTGLKTLNLTGKNTKLKKNCLKNTNKNLVIKVTTKAEKRNIEKQLKKAGNPKAKVKVSKKK